MAIFTFYKSQINTEFNNFMICIHLKNTNPFFCLAAEEYLLKNFSDDIFMLWQSNDTVVLGKHQNALAEINYPFVRKNNITVARRISGGGTVFHDSGNVNFSFIQNVKSPAEISFKQFTQPLVETLARLGVSATTSGRNDLLINGLKISGNAEHVFKNRVLHHGTLLFNSNLENLGKAIKVAPGKYESKAVQSNRSPVSNISSFLKNKIQTNEFLQFLMDVQLEKQENHFYELNESDVRKAEMLVAEKFNSWDWNYGYSPKYIFTNNVELNGRKLHIQLQIKRGKIDGCSISGNYFTDKVLEKLNLVLLSKKHSFESVFETMLQLGLNVNEELVYCFF